MCFYQDGAISLNSNTLDLVNQFIYLGSNILSTENEVTKLIGKAWNTTDKLMTLLKSDLFDKIKQEFFQAVVELAPLEH